jgi:hypothetical protein
MTISLAKRLLFVLIGCITGWAVIFLVVGLPLFHLHFKVPIATITSYVGICCALQVVVVAWLLYARKTAQRSDGWLFHRTLATTLSGTIVSMLFFYYLRRGRPDDPATREFTSIGMGATLLFAFLFLPIIRVIARRTRGS